MKPAKELNLMYIGSTLFICKLKKYHRSDELNYDQIKQENISCK